MLIRGSFEDYIYIIIGVVWIAYSIYKGAKKRKQGVNKPKRESEPQEKKKSVFETFFDEILVEEKPVPYEPIIEDVEIDEEIETEKMAEQKVFSYDDYYEESSSQRDIDIVEKRTLSQSHRKQDLKAIPSKKRKKPRINLRKAVIYSEILNRRYF